MTVIEVRDKYQDIVNAESALIHHSPFRDQIIRSHEERYIRYSALSNAMHAFHYSQKARVVKWLKEQLDIFLRDAAHHENAGVRQLSQWSAAAIQEMLDDLQ